MTNVRMLRLPDVVEKIGVHAATLYRWEQKGLFPRRIQIGPHTVAWRADEIEAWLLARPIGVRRAG
jgi:prophage regulatory protein